jgi:hypothetical protein
LALESGYLASRGRTPHNPMRARLSVDVRDNPQSFFVQRAPGVYGLKDYVPVTTPGGFGEDAVYW